MRLFVSVLFWVYCLAAWWVGGGELWTPGAGIALLFSMAGAIAVYSAPFWDSR